MARAVRMFALAWDGVPRPARWRIIARFHFMTWADYQTAINSRMAAR